MNGSSYPARSARATHWTRNRYHPLCNGRRPDDAAVNTDPVAVELWNPGVRGFDCEGESSYNLAGTYVGRVVACISFLWVNLSPAKSLHAR